MASAILTTSYETEYGEKCIESVDNDLNAYSLKRMFQIDEFSNQSIRRQRYRKRSLNDSTCRIPIGWRSHRVSNDLYLSSVLKIDQVSDTRDSYYYKALRGEY